MHVSMLYKELRRIFTDIFAEVRLPQCYKQSQTIYRKLVQITTPTLTNKLIQLNERLFLASSPKTHGLRERTLLQLSTQSLWISQSGDPLRI